MVVPGSVVQHLRDAQPAEALAPQRVKRRPFGPDQVPGQRIDAYLRETCSLASRREQLQDRLAVGAGRPQMRADRDVAPEHGTQVRLDGPRSRGYLNPQPSAQPRGARAAGQCEGEHPGAGPGPGRSWLAVTAHRGGAGPPARRDKQPGMPGTGQHDELPLIRPGRPAPGRSDGDRRGPQHGTDVIEPGPARAAIVSDRAGRRGALSSGRQRLAQREVRPGRRDGHGMLGAWSPATAAGGFARWFAETAGSSGTTAVSRAGFLPGPSTSRIVAMKVARIRVP